MFNRRVVPLEGGSSGRKFAEFLRLGDEALTFTEMQSKIYDRLYRLGMVRNVDGSRATRKRKRDRDRGKARRRRVKAIS